MRIGLLSAPSNLGLRPPAPTSAPGCAKAPRRRARRVCTGAWLSSARTSEASCCRAGTPTMRPPVLSAISHARLLTDILITGLAPLGRDRQ
jgi:hypothetical protein